MSTSKLIGPQTEGHRTINPKLGRVSAHRCANIDRRLHPYRQVEIPRAMFDKMCGARSQMRVRDCTTRVLCLSMLVSRFPCSETNIRRTRRLSEKENEKALQFRERSEDQHEVRARRYYLPTACSAYDGLNGASGSNAKRVKINGRKARIGRQVAEHRMKIIRYSTARRVGGRMALHHYRGYVNHRRCLPTSRPAFFPYLCTAIQRNFRNSEADKSAR